MRKLSTLKRVMALCALFCAFPSILSAQYCTAAVGTACDISAIKRVAISNIDNDNNICDADILTGGLTDGYSDYTAMTVYMKPGNTYQVTLEIYNGLILDFATLWIDWDLDETWSSDEMVPLVGNDYVLGTYTALVIVPPTAVEDSIGRIRVISDFNLPPLDPCAETYSGEVEDYSFIVTEADPPSTGGGGPAYCAGLVGDPCTQSAIKRFAVGDIDNDNNICDADILTGGLTDGYSDYTDMIATFHPLTPATVTLEIYNSLILDNAVMWVDWNLDGNWSTTEYTVLVGEGYVTNTLSAVLIPPANAVTGKVGRIRVTSDFFLPNTDPCTATFSGEIEDYSFIVLPTGEELPECMDVTAVFPANNSTNNCQQLTLKWPKADNATSYLLTVRDTTDGTIVVNQLSLTDTTYTLPSAFTAGHTYTWIAESLNDGTKGFQCDSATFTTSANDDPITSVLPAGDTLSTCLNSPLILDGNVSQGTAPFTHLWTGSSASKLSQTNIQSVDFSADSVAFYTYRYTVTDANGCKANDSVNVQVRRLPAKGTLSTIDSAYCLGDTAVIRFTGYEGMINWQDSSATHDWMSAPLGQVNDSTFIYEGLTENTYVRALLTSAACGTISGNTLITVHALPAAPVIANLGRDSICAGESTLLQVSNYSENLSWNDMALTAGDSLEVAESGVYTVTYTDSNTCQSSAAYQVHANVEADQPVITVNGASPYCAGDTLFLTATGSNLEWADASGLYTAADTVTVTDNAPYTVRSTNSAGCSAVSDTISVTFNALPPKPTITKENTAHCEGDTVLLGTSAGIPFWNTGDSTHTLVVTTPGAYYLLDVTPAGCLSFSDTIVVTFDSLPATPTIGQVNNDLVADSTGISFRWYNDMDSLMAVTSSASWKPEESGIYYVVAVNAAGCGSAPSPYVQYNVLGIAKNSGSIEGVQIYPNPASGYVMVKTDRNACEVILTDGLGRAIRTWNITSGTNQLNLDVAPGMYLLNISGLGSAKLTVY
ncbi:MAG: GEVED domain-containing protein [Bacteroidota bacterium]